MPQRAPQRPTGAMYDTLGELPRYKRVLCAQAWRAGRAVHAVSQCALSCAPLAGTGDDGRPRVKLQRMQPRPSKHRRLALHCTPKPELHRTHGTGSTQVMERVLLNADVVSLGTLACTCLYFSVSAILQRTAMAQLRTFEDYGCMLLVRHHHFSFPTPISQELSETHARGSAIVRIEGGSAFHQSTLTAIEVSHRSSTTRSSNGAKRDSLR